MKETEFRGKILDIKDWIYGDLLTPTTQGCGSYAILKKGWNVCFAKAVDEKTIGEYIGIKDSNKKKIFTGDIIKVYDEENGEYSIHLVVDKTEDDYPAFDLDPEIPCDCNSFSWLLGLGWKFEIIGNNIDNLEQYENAN